MKVGRSFFDAQDRQANGCLHTNSFAGRKNMEHEVRNVRVRNRAGVSLLDKKMMGGSSMVRTGVLYASNLSSILSRPIRE